MMGHREPLNTAAEHDTVRKMRRNLCYLARPGVTRAVKRQMSRRARRQSRARARARDE